MEISNGACNGAVLGIALLYRIPEIYLNANFYVYPTPLNSYEYLISFCLSMHVDTDDRRFQRSAPPTCEPQDKRWVVCCSILCGNRSVMRLVWLIYPCIHGWVAFLVVFEQAWSCIFVLINIDVSPFLRCCYRCVCLLVRFSLNET